MRYTLTVSHRHPETDAHAKGVLSDMHHFGLTAVERVEVDRVYRLEGALSRAEAERVGSDLLADPVSNTWAMFEGATVTDDTGAHVVEVAYNPGVMDPVEQSVRKSVGDLGIGDVDSVATAIRYRFYGDVPADRITEAATALMVNDTVQHLVTGDESHVPSGTPAPREPVSVPLLEADPDGLAAISRKGGLSLNAEEMGCIQNHFRALERDPTDVELETLAQTWSEHCVHKTFRGKFFYSEDGGPAEQIDNLLKETIVRATRELDLPWCVSVFDDNAGIIEFDEENHLCFKVETHNHPSALEPYGGAGTGIGGVLRDVLGAGLGGQPVANTDVFCFARPDHPADQLPEGVLDPRRVMRGVVSGVRDYGNRMGIPTVNGAVVFDDRYLGNPLVYCGTVGLIPVGCETKEVAPGMRIVVVGGRTGRDGIHGATFSSAELGSDEGNIWSNAVQIGNAITEEKVTDVLMVARDKRLYSGITDCGAGGLSSAVGEMGEHTGAEVDLETVPLKYDGLSYTEIWISEAQERMVLAVPPENTDELLALFASEDVEATVIGTFTDTGRLVLRYHGAEVADLDMGFLHKGVPQVVRTAIWSRPTQSDPAFDEPESLNDSLLAILSHPTVASKEWVVRQYDHEVRGGSVLKPLVGANNDGPSDAAVVRPSLSSDSAIAIANGICPRYGLIDPYWMALAAIDEALRQIVSVGGRRDRTAILDNFCWGNPEVPERLGGFVRAARGCYDAAVAYGTPFISGKDSFYNEYATPEGTISIPPTLLVSGLCVLPDIIQIISMDLKSPGHLIYVVGETKSELGGSHYLLVRGESGGEVPKVDLSTAPAAMDALAGAIRAGLVRACHDCSEGGIGVAVAEMAFAGEVGTRIDLADVPRTDLDRTDTVLFSESPTRWICEVAPENQAAFEAAMGGTVHGRIGETNASDRLVVQGLSGSHVVDLSLAEMKEAWQAPLREV